MRNVFIGFAIALVVMGQLHADWPQFRGPNGSGVATGPEPPIEFGPGKNELWHVDLQSGHSSPCVVGDRIFLTTHQPGSKQLSIVCLNRDDGSTRWQHNISVDKIETGHPSFSPASSSPTSDGQRVVAYFGSYGLICLDIAGKQLWEIKLPLTKSYAGNAISPIIVDDQVILYRGNYVDHYLLSVDKETGKENWKIKQSEKFTPDMACTGIPIVCDDKLIVHTARSVQAFDLATGKRRWIANCKTTATSTPILAGDEVVVATWNQTGEEALTPRYPDYETLLKDNDKNSDGNLAKNEFPKMMMFHRSEGTEAPQNGRPIRFVMVDTNKDGRVGPREWAAWQKRSDERRKTYVPHGLIAIKIDSAGEIDVDNIRYLARDGIPEVPSPLLYRDHVYFVKNGGILTSVNRVSGERVARMRTKGRGTHYASPILCGDKIYSSSGDGIITVVQITDAKPKILAGNDMNDGVYATPAIVDGVLYVRTHKKLFAFKRQQ